MHNELSVIISPEPWLSVVLPSFRGERWIDTALQSIASQSSSGVEVLLVDGSPTVAMREIASGYQSRLSLRTFERPDLESWQAKSNFAVEMARSSHICWLGVDDVWLPGRLKAVQRWIDADPAAPLHVAPSLIIDKTGRGLGVWKCPLPVECRLTAQLVLPHLLVQNFIGAPAPVFRRDAWLACGGLDVTLWYTADWDMWLKLASQGDLVAHSEITIGFRVHGNSLTVTGSRNFKDFARQMEIVLDRHSTELDTTAANEVRRTAKASIAVNSALVAASSGNFRPLACALWRIMQLGPRGMHRYFRDSRILDRIWPRLRAQLTGSYS